MGNFLDPPHLLGKARLVKVTYHIFVVLAQVWPTCWNTPFSMPRSYFHTRASVSSWVSREAATMPSLPPPTPTSTSTSRRSTSWTRWTGSCRTWCAQYCTVLYCTVLQVRVAPGVPRVPRADGGGGGGDHPVRAREEQTQRRVEAQPGAGQ